MKVAILGAGFAGLSVAWYLLHYTRGSIKIDLFDPEPIGKGSSGIASGLLHPYVGKQARKAWQSDKGFKETHRLITEASHCLGQSLISSRGILRPALSEQQLEDFRLCAQEHSDTEWWDKERCEKSVPGLVLPEISGGLFIKSGLTLDASLYLQGLWQACALHGTQLKHQALTKTEEIQSYDRVLIAMGPLAKQFPLLKDLPFSVVKGQILELKWPDNLPPLPFSLNSKKHLVLLPDQKRCLAGSTYEREFTSSLPDKEKAKALILPEIASFFPSLENAEVLGCRAGLRAYSPNHLPMVGKINEKVWFFTGLGSKGLLYHAWIGKLMARALLTQDTKHLPPDLCFSIPGTP